MKTYRLLLSIAITFASTLTAQQEASPNPSQAMVRRLIRFETRVGAWILFAS